MLTGPILGPDSALRRVPVALDHCQRLFVDGRRFSIEMPDVAYTRLCASALQIGGQDLDAELRPAPDTWSIPVIMLDAWSVVDAVQRLRTLIEGFPGL